MKDYEFFYADIEADSILLGHYSKGDYIHANNGVVASRLRGGLLDGCNARFSFVPHPHDNYSYRQMDEDYKNQQPYVYDNDLTFEVFDKFYYGGSVQVLMCSYPLEDDQIEEIIRYARADFKQLHDKPPVDVLNNQAWRARVRKVPGIDGKNSPGKGFLTMYWK
jgi:hypothetical protein